MFRNIQKIEVDDRLNEIYWGGQQPLIESLRKGYDIITGKFTRLAKIDVHESILNWLATVSDKFKPVDRGAKSIIFSRKFKISSAIVQSTNKSKSTRTKILVYEIN